MPLPIWFAMTMLTLRHSCLHTLLDLYFAHRLIYLDIAMSWEIILTVHSGLCWFSVFTSLRQECMISLMSWDTSISESKSSGENNLCVASTLGLSDRSKGFSKSLITYGSAAYAFSVMISVFWMDQALVYYYQSLVSWISPGDHPQGDSYPPPDVPHCPISEHSPIDQYRMQRDRQSIDLWHYWWKELGAQHLLPIVQDLSLAQQQ